MVRLSARLVGHAAAAVTVTCLLSPRVAITSAQQTFKTRVDVLRLDVTVLDRDRRPVSGLTAADFLVEEDGEPRRIVDVTEIQVPVHSTRSLPWSATASSDVRTNAPPDGRLLVIVLDDATMPFDARILDDARRIASGLIDRLGPSDQAAVLFTREIGKGQNLTDDRSRLLAAVSKLKGGTYRAEGLEYRLDADRQYERMSVRTVQEAAGYLARVPNRRKIIAYISTGIPFDPPDLVHAMRDLRTSIDEGTRQISLGLIGAFDEALRANVQVYTFDPGGLGGVQFYLEHKVRIARRLTPAVVERIYRDSRLHREFLKTFADRTGGRAALDTNGFDLAIEQLFTDTGHYYFLAFESVTKPGARLRNLRLKVRRPGLSVLARQGTLPVASATTPQQSVAAPESAIAGLLPQSEIPLRMMLAPMPVRPAEAAVVIALGANLQSLSDGQGPLEFTLHASAFSVVGEKRAGADFRVSVPPSEPGDRDVLTTLRLPPGRYEIRVGARAAGKVGSVYADVDVPEFAPSRLTLSGILLQSNNQMSPLTSRSFVDLGTISPTSRRDFDRTETLHAFVRAIQSQDLVPTTSIAWRLQDVRERDHPLASPAQAPWKAWGDRGSATDSTQSIPLATLLAGPYLLTIEAVAGNQRAVRQVAFTVR